MRPIIRMLATGVLLAGLSASVPPSASAAEIWWFDHDQGRFPTTELPKEVAPNIGTLKVIDKKGKGYGACSKTVLQGTVANKMGGMAEGTITGFKIEEGNECKEVPPGCELKKFEPLTAKNWTLTQLEENSEVEITNFKITIELDEACKAELAVESTVEGTIKKNAIFIPWDGLDGPLIKFEKAEIGTTGLSVEGEMRFGTYFTSLSEPGGGLKATSSPAKLDGNGGTFVFTRGTHVVECAKTTFTATAKDEDTTIDIEPKYEECKSSLGTVTVQMNGCKFRLHVESELIEGESYTYQAPTDVICEEEKEIEIEGFIGTEHESKEPSCRYGIGPEGNEGRESIDLTNKLPTGELSKAWIEAHVEVQAIRSKLLEGSVFLCGSELDTAGKLEGVYEVTGTEGEELENGIALFP